MKLSNLDKKDINKVLKNERNTSNKIYNKKEDDLNTVEWQMFYLNNLDIFTEDYLGIKLKTFQKQIIMGCWNNDIETIIASRGLSKTFTTGILANNLALLIAGIDIVITSLSLGQANKIIDEKIDRELSSDDKGISQVMKQLRADGYITFKNNATTKGRVVEYGNGSRIMTVACDETGRGERCVIVITDEARLVKKKYYDSITEPFLQPYNKNGLFIEPKQIFLSSARTKDSWLWRYLRDTVNGHYKDKDVKYGFFAGDIYTAVASGIQTKKQLKTRKKNTNEYDFAMEYENLWLGENEDSLFSFDDFHKMQTLTKVFLPRNGFEVLESEENSFEFDENDIRAMSVDIAVSSGKDNDNTVFTLGAMNTEIFNKKIEYISAKNGLNSLKQVVLMKRLFYEYKCSYFVMDSKGVGNVIYDMLTVETFDDEYNKTYPAWTVCTDKTLQISSDTVVNDKISRTISQEAEPVIIVVAGTSEINSQMHLSMKKTLKDSNIEFLRDDAEMESILLDRDAKWILKSPEEKARILLPFKETRFMINESVALSVKNTGGIIKVEEDRSKTKDRYMSMTMLNYFFEKLSNKYIKDDQQYDNEDISAWSFLAKL
ncbi:MAG: hypothetical protein BV457_08010 [Thermoplasmata archaeon M9B1D]|nr:MAG: hypothetical protein BV457_08010 [Thermoplasmata archaeon M9B1D]